MSSAAAAAAAKWLQSCPTLCDPIDGSRPGSPVPGILQVRTLECKRCRFNPGVGKIPYSRKSFDSSMGKLSTTGLRTEYEDNVQSLSPRILFLVIGIQYPMMVIRVYDPVDFKQ